MPYKHTDLNTNVPTPPPPTPEPEVKIISEPTTFKDWVIMLSVVVCAICAVWYTYDQHKGPSLDERLAMDRAETAAMGIH